MKSESGITLLVLIITVLIMIILAGAGIKYGGTSISEVRLQKFSYELQQIQGRVDSVYEKMNMESDPTYIYLNKQPMGVNIGYSTDAVKTLKKVKGLDYNSPGSSTNVDLYYKGQGTDAYYRYFSKQNLEQQLDIRNPSQDVIINFKTREVISIKGQKYESRTYYRIVNGELRFS